MQRRPHKNTPNRIPTRMLLGSLVAAFTLAGLAGSATANHPEAIPCPEGLHAEALQNEDIVLTWDEVEEADFYTIIRIAGDDRDTLEVFTTEDTTYHDTNTTVNEVYRYTVSSALEPPERHTSEEDCPSVEVNAIPFFGSSALAALGAVVAIGGYAIAKRRP